MRRGEEVIEEWERGIGKEKNRVKNRKDGNRKKGGKERQKGEGQKGKRGKGEVPACRKGQKAAFAAPTS